MLGHMAPACQPQNYSCVENEAPDRHDDRLKNVQQLSTLPPARLRTNDTVALPIYLPPCISRQNKTHSVSCLHAVNRCTYRR
ncbi:hypothetical protein L2E82_24673 [Cichorium intybus]|uniref:Uncharacterized protein n=1 Tax=Cichorium intybus TaxID=13427 RepID=A0ACB9E1X1_CICIN|nr:hypothetical protein L2E82_24673 [Cichorium intybus]